MTVPDLGDYATLVRHLAQVHPHDLALVDARGPLSRGDLAEESRKVASVLQGLSVEAGDVVAVWLPNRREWLATALANGLLGAVTLGLNTRLRSHEVSALLKESRATVLMVDPTFKDIDFSDMIGGLAAELPDLRVVLDARVGDVPKDSRAALPELPGIDTVHLRESIDAASDPGPGMATTADPDAPTQAVTSSGSSGTPKVVLHSQTALLFHATHNAEAFGLTTAASAALVALPLCGVFGFNAALSALVAGAPVVLQEVFAADESLDLIEEYGVTHLNASDTMLDRLLTPLEQEDWSAPTWHSAAFGKFTPGDPAELIRRGEAQGRTFFQTYGSSEVLSTLTRPAAGADLARRAVGGGVPISEEIVLDIRDDEGHSLPPGEQGQLYVGGPTVSVGYLRAGQRSPLSTTPDGLLATGDLGYRVDDKDVAYLGRMDDTVRIAGFLFSPKEVEAYLDTLPGVSRSAVVPVEHQGAVRLVAFLTARDQELDLDTVRARSRAELAAFKQPQAWVVLEQLPIIAGANGEKIDKRTLVESGRGALSEQVGGSS